MVILITGATGGIGHATTHALAAAGHTLVLTARDQNALNGLAREVEAQYGIFALPIAADVTKPNEVQTVVAHTVEECEQLNGVVVAHGIGHLADGLTLDTTHLESMLAVNVTGTFHVLQAAAQAMAEQRRGGRIVLLPGTMGAYTMPKAAGYAASKWATVGMAKSIAQDFRRIGVTLTLIYLGGVNTSFWDGIDMRIQREKMLTPDSAAAAIRFALEQPDGGVLNEITLQPESHQYF
jgi:NADP-dependent 3-hydroxy acid dehydrogenase YdfG